MKTGGRNTRPAQFAAYRALKGYEEMLAEHTREREPRVRMTEESEERLSRQLGALSRGDAVVLKYYEADAYRVLRGTVKECDSIFQTVRIDRREIPFGDLLWIRKEDRGERAGETTDSDFEK